MSNYTKKAVKGAGIVFIMSMLASLFSYFFRILLARNLTVEEYGLVYAIFALFGIVSLFKTLGINTALPKFIAEFKTKNQIKKTKSSIIASTIIMIIPSIIIVIIFILISDFLAQSYFKNPVSSILIKIYALTFLLSPIYTIIHSIFVGYQEHLHFKIMDFSREVLLFVITYILLLFGLKIFSPIYAHILTFIILIIIYSTLLFKKLIPNFFKIKSDINKETYKKLIYFALPIILVGVASKVFSYTDVIILTYFRSLAEVGLYNATMPTARILWRIGITLSVVLLPLSSELWNKKEFSKIKQGISFLNKYTYLFILPCAIILFLYPKLVLSTLFGENYIAGILTLQILVIGAIFIIISKINFSMITGFGKPGFVAKITTITAIINLIGNLILIPLWGIEGAAISTTISFLIMAIFSIIGLKKLIKIKSNYNTIIKTIIASILFALSIQLFKSILNLNIWIELIIVLAISGLIYLFLIFTLKITTITEIKMILNRMKK